MGKTVMSVVRQDVQETTGSIQVCAGQPGGCEAAIHAMKDLFDDDETEIVLLMDALNAFNSINRATMLRMSDDSVQQYIYTRTTVTPSMPGYL